LLLLRWFVVTLFACWFLLLFGLLLVLVRFCLWVLPLRAVGCCYAFSLVGSLVRLRLPLLFTFWFGYPYVRLFAAVAFTFAVGSGSFWFAAFTSGLRLRGSFGSLFVGSLVWFAFGSRLRAVTLPGLFVRFARLRFFTFYHTFTIAFLVYVGLFVRFYVVWFVTVASWFLRLVLPLAVGLRSVRFLRLVLVIRTGSLRLRLRSVYPRYVGYGYAFGLVTFCGWFRYVPLRFTVYGCFAGLRLVTFPPVYTVCLPFVTVGSFGWLLSLFVTVYTLRFTLLRLLVVRCTVTGYGCCVCSGWFPLVCSFVRSAVLVVLRLFSCSPGLRLVLRFCLFGWLRFGCSSTLRFLVGLVWFLVVAVTRLRLFYVGLRFYGLFGLRFGRFSSYVLRFSVTGLFGSVVTFHVLRLFALRFGCVLFTFVHGLYVYVAAFTFGLPHVAVTLVPLLVRSGWLRFRFMYGLRLVG